MINIRITEIDRPHCMGCGKYCQPKTKGKSINLNYGFLVTCDDCYSELVTYIVKLEKSKLEEKNDDSRENKM